MGSELSQSAERRTSTRERSEPPIVTALTPKRTPKRRHYHVYVIELDRRVLDALRPHCVDAIVLAGYMSVVTSPLLAAFAGRIVNVHPADLRILEGGRRKYTGDYAVRDAILAGECVLRATTHIVRAEVDGGEILMVSAPVRVELPEGVGPGMKRGPVHFRWMGSVKGSLRSLAMADSPCERPSPRPSGVNSTAAASPWWRSSPPAR